MSNPYHHNAFRAFAAPILLSVLLAVPACRGGLAAECEAPCPAGGHWQGGIRCAITPIDPSTKADAVPEAERSVGAFTVGVYHEGRLVYQHHSEGPLSASMSAEQEGALREDLTYNWYAVAGGIAHRAGTAGGETINDGALESMPQDEDELLAWTYYSLRPGDVVPLYGLDFSGCLLGMTPSQADGHDGSADGTVVISLGCLWAKVSVCADHLTPYGTMSFLAVSACGQAHLQPFGEDRNRDIHLRYATGEERMRFAAASPAHGLGASASGLTAAQRTGSDPVVVYLPENRMGDLLPENRSSRGKTPAAVTAECGSDGLLPMGNYVSYVEVRSRLTSPAVDGVTESGAGAYRICVGADNHSNFDVVGGTHYRIALTLTEEGLWLGDWKSGHTLSDSRSLSVQGIQDVRMTAEGPRLEMGESITIAQGRSAACRVRYAWAASQTDAQQSTNAVSAFGTATGWRMTPGSEALLAERGISWEMIEGRAIYVSTSYPGYVVLDQDGYLEWKGSRPIFAEFDEGGPSCYVVFTDTGSLPAGSVIPVTFETFDSRHSVTVSLQASLDGDFVGRAGFCDVGVYTPVYAYSVPAGVTKVRYTTASTALSLRSATGEAVSSVTNDVTQVTEGGVTRHCDPAGCMVLPLTPSASETVRCELYYGGAWHSSNINGHEYLITMEVTPLQIELSRDAVDLFLDGTRERVDVLYHTSHDSRTVLRPASTEAEAAADSRTISPSMWAGLLKPVTVLSSSANRGYGLLLGTWANASGASRVEVGITQYTASSGGRTYSVDDLFGASRADVLRVLPCGGTSFAQSRPLAVRSHRPFSSDCSSSTEWGVLLNYSMCAVRDQGLEKTIDPDAGYWFVGRDLGGHTFTLDDGAHASSYSLTAEGEMPDLAFGLVPAGTGANDYRVRPTYRDGATGATGGRKALRFTVRNTASGRTWTRDVGWLDIYCIVPLTAKATRVPNDRSFTFEINDSSSYTDLIYDTYGCTYRSRPYIKVSTGIVTTMGGRSVPEAVALYNALKNVPMVVTNFDAPVNSGTYGWMTGYDASNPNTSYRMYFFDKGTDYYYVGGERRTLEAIWDMKQWTAMDFGHEWGVIASEYIDHIKDYSAAYRMVSSQIVRMADPVKINADVYLMGVGRNTRSGQDPSESDWDCFRSRFRPYINFDFGDDALAEMAADGVVTMRVIDENAGHLNRSVCDLLGLSANPYYVFMHSWGYNDLLYVGWDEGTHFTSWD